MKEERGRCEPANLTSRLRNTDGIYPTSTLQGLLSFPPLFTKPEENKNRPVEKEIQFSTCR